MAAEAALGGGADCKDLDAMLEVFLPPTRSAVADIN